MVDLTWTYEYIYLARGGFIRPGDGTVYRVLSVGTSASTTSFDIAPYSPIHNDD